jgi:hypothetical protein
MQDIATIPFSYDVDTHARPLFMYPRRRRRRHACHFVRDFMVIAPRTFLSGLTCQVPFPFAFTPSRRCHTITATPFTLTNEIVVSPRTSTSQALTYPSSISIFDIIPPFSDLTRLFLAWEIYGCKSMCLMDYSFLCCENAQWICKAPRE